MGDVRQGRLVGPLVLSLTLRATSPSKSAKATPKASKGFDTGFLAEAVDLPTFKGAAAKDALVVDGSPVVDYTHFSLTTSASRRFARWVAWNVDGARLLKLSRTGLKFHLDPRLPATAQVGDDLYAGNRLDRGHIARRADLTWGDPKEAQQANVDSFSFPNITPQMDDFNQSRRAGVWGRIEDAVYEQVDVQDLRISVFGGPIFHDDDIAYRGVQLPREFWKVVAYLERGRLKAQAFLLMQNPDHREALSLDEFRTYQINLTNLAERTSIDFGKTLTQANPSIRSATARQPLETVDDIRW